MSFLRFLRFWALGDKLGGGRGGGLPASQNTENTEKIHFSAFFAPGLVKTLKNNWFFCVFCVPGTTTLRNKCLFCVFCVFEPWETSWGREGGGGSASLPKHRKHRTDIYLSAICAPQTQKTQKSHLFLSVFCSRPPKNIEKIFVWRFLCSWNKKSWKITNLAPISISFANKQKEYLKNPHNSKKNNLK